MATRTTTPATSSLASNGRTILLIFACYLVFTYNKKCVTYQYTHLIREFGLTQQNAGSISSAQQFSISAVTFLGGILSDYVPSTFLYPLGMILCGSATFLFPLGSSTTYFASVWFLNGIGQGLALPCAMRLVKQFSSGTTFATNWSFVLTAVNIAGVFNPMASAYLASTFSWQTAVYLSGCIITGCGLLGLVLFNQLAAQTDEKTVELKKKGDNKKSSKSIKLAELLVFPVLWIIIGNRFIVTLHRLSTSDWTQMYFTTEKDLSEYYGSLYVTAFEFASVFGKLLSGRINDYFMSRYLVKAKSPLFVRLPISMTFHAANILSMFLYCNFISASSSLPCILFVAVLSGIFSSGNIITLSVLSTEISTKQHEGLVTSLCNLAAKVGAFCSGYPFTLIAFLFNWYWAYSFIFLLTLFTLAVDVVFYRRSSKYKIE